LRDYQLIIEGAYIESTSGGRFPVTNPANSEAAGSVPDGTPEDANLAVEAAGRAFPAWAALAPGARADLMRKAAQLVRTRKQEIAATLTLEQGKPLGDAGKEVLDAAATIDYFAEEAIRVLGEVIPTGSQSALSIVVKQPVGPCVLITPWNYPISLLSWKMGPALAAGCTVVAKPPSVTPLSTFEFLRCFIDAGFPKGVINLVTGAGGRLSRALIAHPLTRKVAITGSTEVGIQVAATAGEHLKKVSLELGGHSPFLVFADADLKTAVIDCVRRSFRNTGQICNSVNRVFVHKSLAASFVDQLVEATRKLVVGNGLEKPNVDLGPMVNQEGVERTLHHIQDAVGRGARLLCGGSRPSGEEFEKGFYLEPAVLDDVPPEALIMSEETFGPAVAVSSFSTLDEAIQQANATRYGLVAYAYTKDLATVQALINRLDFGTVCVNNTAAASYQTPYGGWKDSGLGVELSHHAMDEYLRLKHIRIQS
jgi:succinate-semialdehyde dehydrogenase / glutarate-semialdehyde dehydrogenase